MLMAVLGGINPHRPDKCVRTDLKKDTSVFGLTNVLRP